MGGLQPWHWVIVIAVFVLLFGAKKLPDAARSLGKSMRIFKSEIKEMQADSDSAKSGQASDQAVPIASERPAGPTDGAAPGAAADPTSDKRTA